MVALALITAVLDVLEAHPELAARARTALGVTAASVWLPVATAAAELGVKPRVIRDAARRGELVLGGAGRRPVVERSELARWVATRAVVVPSRAAAPAPVVEQTVDAVVRRLRRAG